MVSWACEEALHLGKSPEVTREQHAKEDASARCGEKSGSLQQSLINFHSTSETAGNRKVWKLSPETRNVSAVCQLPASATSQWRKRSRSKILQLQLQRQDYQKKKIGLDILICIVVYKLSRSCNPWIQLRRVVSQRSYILFKLWRHKKSQVLLDLPPKNVYS